MKKPSRQPKRSTTTDTKPQVKEVEAEKLASVTGGVIIHNNLI
jgi:hypothetical protein